MIVELNSGKEDMKLALERDNTINVIFVDTGKIPFGKTWGVSHLILIYIY